MYMAALASFCRQMSAVCMGCNAVSISTALLGQTSARGIHIAAQPYARACTRLMVNEGTGFLARDGDEWMATQRRWRFGIKLKRAITQRITKNAAGQYLAWHAHNRHKRYNKSRKQLQRLAGKFVLPDYMQRKLRKAGY